MAIANPVGLAGLPRAIQVIAPVTLDKFVVALEAQVVTVILLPFDIQTQIQVATPVEFRTEVGWWLDASDLRL